VAHGGFEGIREARLCDDLVEAGVQGGGTLGRHHARRQRQHGHLRQLGIATKHLRSSQAAEHRHPRFHHNHGRLKSARGLYSLEPIHRCGDAETVGT
jgi:hypothetical protein